MALLTNCNLEIHFQNRMFDIEQYLEVLTSEQISEIKTEIIKNVSLNNLYAKIGNIQGNKELLTISLEFYNDKNKDKLIERKYYKFKPDLYIEDNFIKQGYEYLKTLPEYINAVDLLDEGQTV